MPRPGGSDKGLFERPVGSGKWYACWSEQGRIQKKLVGAKSNARAYVEKKREEARLGKLFPERVESKRRIATVRQLVDRYRPDWQRLASSQECYRDAETWATYFGDTLVNNIRTSDIEAWRSAKLQTCKPGSVNRYVSFLRRLFNRAVDDGILVKNPAASKVLPRLKEEHSVKFLPEDQQEALLAALSPEMARAVEVAILLGMRSSEQFGMLKDDLNLCERLAIIRKSKNGKARYLPLSDRLVQIFKEQIDHESKFIWPGYDGRSGVYDLKKHRMGTSANQALQRACKRAGIPVLNWHALRHTFGTRAAVHGDMRTVQEFMGHSSLSMTERYSHVTSDRLRSLGEKLSALTVKNKK